jgi:hypothetical protein
MLVRAIREGWSPADMVLKLGVTRAHIAAIERGKVASAESAVRYARALCYCEQQFVRLALQDEIKRAGLRHKVEVSAA